jgi:glycine betaine catabolism B
MQLRALTVGDVVIASQLAGDFILPKETTKKIALIAGGIGVTPFRSQLQHVADKNEIRDIVLFYGNNTIAEVAYGELFAKLGAKIGLKTIYVFAKEPASNEYETGYFSAEIVKRHLSDYAERTWYISGPPPLVHSAETVLRSLKVPRKNIKKDFFPGLG